MLRLRSTHALLLCALTGCAQCPDPFAPPGSPVTTLHYPTGLALHPTQPILFIASSNFDLNYSGGAVMAANVDYLLAQLELHGSISDPIKDPFQAAVRVPSIGGPLLLTPDGSSLFHVTRQKNVIVQLDIQATEDSVSMDCGTGDALPLCDSGDHVYQVSQVDPYGLTMEKLDDRWRLYVSMLRNGHILGVDYFPNLAGPQRLVQAFDLDMGDANRGGSLDILPSSGGRAPYLFATGRDLPGNSLQLGVIRNFSLWDNPLSTPILSMDFFAQVGSVDVRGLTFSKDATRAYVVSKIPGALLEVDVTRRPDGTPRGTVLRMVPLGKEPSVITTYEPPQGPRLLLVASFKDNHLLAVDMDTLQVFGAVRDVCASPYDIVVDERHGYAFVSCFNEDTVAVIRLPRSLDDRAFNLAAKLGTPRSDQNTNPDVPGFLPAIPNLN